MVPLNLRAGNEERLCLCLESIRRGGVAGRKVFLLNPDLNSFNEELSSLSTLAAGTQIAAAPCAIWVLPRGDFFRNCESVSFHLINCFVADVLSFGRRECRRCCDSGMSELGASGRLSERQLCRRDEQNEPERL